jgi:hypothetical protein
LREAELGHHWLTKACEDRSFELLALKVDPRFDTLRNDKRFAAAIARVGLG